MNAIFMNSKNSRTSDPHRLLLNLSDKMNVKRSEKYVALSNLSIYYTRKNIKKSYKNPTWNEEFELPVGSHSDHILFKKHGEKTDNPSIRIYIH